MFNEGRNAEIQDLTEQIEEVKKVEYMLSARKDIVEIMRVRLASFPCTTYLLLYYCAPTKTVNAGCNLGMCIVLCPVNF